ncbi:MAG: hypothetical protein IJ365_01805 [Clostridia bacterium]|nr:hypothetical protein [Clostridia bacterium]
MDWNALQLFAGTNAKATPSIGHDVDKQNDYIKITHGIESAAAGGARFNMR